MTLDTVSLCLQGDTYLHIYGTKTLPKMVCSIKSKLSCGVFFVNKHTKQSLHSAPLYRSAVAFPLDCFTSVSMKEGSLLEWFASLNARCYRGGA